MQRSEGTRNVGTEDQMNECATEKREGECRQSDVREGSCEIWRSCAIRDARGR